MNLWSALIVDEIRERDDGSVDLLGLREDLYFDAVPVILERMTFFLEFQLEPGDAGSRHEVELRVVDGGGKTLGATPIRFRLPADYPRPTAPLDPTVFEIHFHDFGLHTVEVILAGEVVRRMPLNVLPRENDES